MPFGVAGRAFSGIMSRGRGAGPIAGGGGGGEEYWWGSLAPDFIVDPARTSNGTGSEGNPYQPSQIISFDGAGGTTVNPGGQRVIFEWLPGNLDYSDPRSGNYRPAYIRQVMTGASGQPVIHRARYKAGDPSVSSGNYTSVRRTGGLGSILGVGVPGSGLSDIYFDGFNIPTWAGSDGAAASEVFMYSLWSATRCKGVRMRLDGESAGAISVPSNNYGSVWHQDSIDCEFADSLVQNIGSTSGSQIWSGAEHYSVDGLLMHHNEFNNVRGQCIFEKGATTFDNLRSRYYNNIIHDTFVGCFQYIHYGTATLADCSWWYKNNIYDVGESAFLTNGLAAVGGYAFVNNTVARIGAVPRPGFFGGAGAYISPDIDYEAILVARNNIFFDLVYSYYGEDGLDYATSWGSAPADVDRNLHFGGTAISNSGGADRNLAYCQGTLGIDANGIEDDPDFTNEAGDDFTLQGSSPALALGRDYLNLHGGGTSAVIPAGCYTGQSDVIGRRF